MATASPAFELIAFELAEAAPGRALLRLDARWHGTPLSGRPVLVIDDGRRRHRHDPMLAPPRPPGVIRAAYPAANELIEREVTFLLDLGDGTVLSLPGPSPWRRSQGPAVHEVPPQAPANAGPEAGLAELRHSAEVELLRQELVAARADLRAEQEHAQALQAQAQELHLAIAGLSALRERDEVRAEVLADAVHSEADRRALNAERVAQLEHRLEQLVGELASVAAARADAEQVAADLLAQAASADPEQEAADLPAEAASADPEQEAADLPAQTASAEEKAPQSGKSSIPEPG